MKKYWPRYVVQYVITGHNLLLRNSCCSVKFRPKMTNCYKIYFLLLYVVVAYVCVGYGITRVRMKLWYDLYLTTNNSAILGVKHSFFGTHVIGFNMSANYTKCQEMVVWETWSCQRILHADSATIMTGSIWRCMVFWYKIEKYGCCIIQRNALGCRIQRMYGWLLSDIYIYLYIYIDIALIFERHISTMSLCIINWIKPQYYNNNIPRKAYTSFQPRNEVAFKNTCLWFE